MVRFKPGLMISILFLFFVNSSFARDISIAALNYEPYYGEKLPDDGLLGEIVREAFKAVGYNCTITYYPWIKALSIAREGKVDALLSIWYSKDREEDFYFSAPLPANALVFYHFRGKVNRNSFRDGWGSLNKYRIGGVKGYVYPEEVAKIIADYSLSDKDNLIKLAKGSLDLIIIDYFQADYILRTQLPSLHQEMDPIYPIYCVKTQYLGISKKTRDAEKISLAFNTGLLRISESGLLKQIKKKHGYTLGTALNAVLK